MSKSELGIDWPCSTPWYKRQRGVLFDVCLSGWPKKGIRLYRNPEKAAAAWAETHGNRPAGVSGEVSTFADAAEFIGFVDEHWEDLLAEELLYAVHTSKSKGQKGQSIGGLFREHDQERFERRTAYRPRHDWSKPSRDRDVFLPLNKSGRVVTPSFTLTECGMVSLIDGTTIAAKPRCGAPHSQVDEYLDFEALHPAAKRTSSTGSFFLDRSPTGVEVIFESNSGELWEFHFEMRHDSPGRWYERPFVEADSWHPERGRITQTLRRPLKQ